MKIGLFGFGCVGQGLYTVLQETQGIEAEIKAICIKNPEKPRSLAQSLFTTDKAVLLDDSEIDVIVELIDDAEVAYEITKEALQNGKAVVSANKKMIARHLPELLEIQQRTKSPFLYEGACCASIPILRNLEEYFNNDLLNSVSGIVNGTTNYILSLLFQSKSNYDSALREAKANGFAESDPTLDVEGIDAKFKLCILLFHAFGLLIAPEKVFNFGIRRISEFDVQFARSRKCCIKLLAKCIREEGSIRAWVIPSLIAEQNAFSNVNGAYNAISLQTAFSDKQLLIGKGAGGTATGSAVLSDIAALRYGYRYENHKYWQDENQFNDEQQLIQLYVRHDGKAAEIVADFEQIRERYQSANEHYLVGAIRLGALKKATWLEDPAISILEIPEAN